MTGLQIVALICLGVIMGTGLSGLLYILSGREGRGIACMVAMVALAILFMVTWSGLGLPVPFPVPFPPPFLSELTGH
jgi:hypothetical protein